MSHDLVSPLRSTRPWPAALARDGALALERSRATAEPCSRAAALDRVRTGEVARTRAALSVGSNAASIIRSRAAAIALAVILTPTIAAAEPGVFLDPDVVVLAQLEGDAGGGLFGWAVSEVADLDRDGAMEAMTSAPFNSLGGEGAGAIYLYSGRTAASILHVVGEPGDRLGYAIADAGDVDADGVSDVIAGAPGNGPGRALVYSGADGSLLLTLSGEGDGGFFGAAVASAGDIDGDGHHDLLIGAPQDTSGGPAGGRAYVFSGVDGALLWTREGAPGVQLGGGTAPLGDVDDDQIPDVIVGAPGQGGAVYVLSGVDGADVYPPLVADMGGATLGQFFVGGLGDLDRDGAPEIYGGDYGDNGGGKASGKAYVWSGLSGERLFTFDDGGAGDGCGCGRRAGDVDQDGVPDVSVGCYSASPGGAAQAGSIALYSGSDGALLRAIRGTTPGEQFGFDVVTLGDVDSDGHDDLLVAGANDNRVYILGGAPAGDDTTGTTGDDTSSSGDPSETGSMTTGATTATTGPTSDTATSDGSSTGGGATGVPDTSAGGSGDGGEASGCSCRAASDPRGGLGLGLLGLVGLLTAAPRRRRWFASAR